ncbi:hypothetical protein LPJ63_005130, partial [Coemansia sp. RSA 2711]
MAAAATATASSASSNTIAKPFRPLFKDNIGFVVHDKPVALQVNSADSNTAQLVGTQLSGGEQAIASAVVEYLSSAQKISANNIRVTDIYTDAASEITHVYLVQTMDGVDITNAVANVNVSKDKK